MQMRWAETKVTASTVVGQIGLHQALLALQINQARGPSFIIAFGSCE